MMMDMYQVKNIKNLRETVKNMVMNVLNLGCRPNRRKNSIQELQNKLALKICWVSKIWDYFSGLPKNYCCRHVAMMLILDIQWTHGKVDREGQHYHLQDIFHVEKISSR